MKYKNPFPTVDIIIASEKKEVVLVKRGREPFKGYWALPGGYVEYGETTENAAIREAKEETSLNVKLDRLLGVYSDPERDPSRHKISIVYISTKFSGKLKAGDDAADAGFFRKINRNQLAFDHAKILEDSNLIVIE